MGESTWQMRATCIFLLYYYTSQWKSQVTVMTRISYPRSPDSYIVHLIRVILHTSLEFSVLYISGNIPSIQACLNFTLLCGLLIIQLLLCACPHIPLPTALSVV